MRPSYKVTPARLSRNIIITIISCRCADAKREATQFAVRKVRRKTPDATLRYRDCANVSDWTCESYLGDDVRPEKNLATVTSLLLISRCTRDGF